MNNLFKISFVMALLLMAGAAANAQTTVADTAAKKYVHLSAKARREADFVYVQNNVLMLHQSGTNAILHQNYICRDGGTTITPELELVRKDNSILKLHNGDKIYRDGTIKLARKKK